MSRNKSEPRLELRAATRIHHDRVDRLFGRFDLSEHDHYRRFLMMQAAAFIPVEEALDRDGVAALAPDWPRRRRSALLREDLQDLGARPDEPLESPRFGSPAALLGGLYVLEGSRLGGAVLRRKVAPQAPTRFLGAAAGPGAWPALVALINAELSDADRLGQAATAAQAVFELFEQAGRRAT